MTPKQEKAARDHKKRQARDKRFADIAANMEKNPRRLWFMGTLLVAILAIQLWPK